LGAHAPHLSEALGMCDSSTSTFSRISCFLKIHIEFQRKERF